MYSSVHTGRADTTCGLQIWLAVCPDSDGAPRYQDLDSGTGFKGEVETLDPKPKPNMLSPALEVR